MLSNKEWKLLQELYEHQSTYQTSQNLAKVLEISDRTVRKYLTALTQYVQGYGAMIEMKYGSGYRLIITDQQAFLDMFEQLHVIKEKLTDVWALEENADREHYLLQQLFFKEIAIDISNVMAELHVSRTTVSNILTTIRQRFKSYNLKLKKTPNGTYIVEGMELDKRYFIVDYFLASNFKHPLLINIKSQTLLSDLDLSQMAHLILESCKEANLVISDYILTNLIIHIALTVHRIRTGHIIADYPIDQTVQVQVAYGVAKRIIQKLTKALNLEFPKGETANIALHLLTKAKDQNQVEMDLPKEAEEEVRKVLRKIDVEIDSHLQEDKTLLNNLLAHLNPLLLRLKYHIRMDNPLREEIMKSYPEFFQLTKKYFQELVYLKDYDLSDDEWSYIALHLIAAFERENTVQVINVLLVCATGFGSAQVLRNRASNQFPNRLNIVDCISYHELSNDKLDGVDLIISSIDLGEILFQIPNVTVSVFLNKADVDRINQAIQMLGHPNHYLPKQTNQVGNWEEHFDNCFSPDKFLLIAGQRSKEEIIQQMIGHLDEAENPDFVKVFYQAVQEREVLSSTAFSDLMAFPHVVTAIGFKEEIVVAVLEREVAWDAYHPNVRIVVLLSPSRFDNPHLRVMSTQLAQLANQIELQEEFLVQATFVHF